VADSSLAHDRETKAGLYSDVGVPEYWVVDVRGRAVHVHDQIAEGRYTRVRTFDEATEVSPAAFPDVAISVAELFG
jgi:Uma2 family endonuclease